MKKSSLMGIKRPFRLLRFLGAMLLLLVFFIYGYIIAQENGAPIFLDNITANFKAWVKQTTPKQVNDNVNRNLPSKRIASATRLSKR